MSTVDFGLYVTGMDKVGRAFGEGARFWRDVPLKTVTQLTVEARNRVFRKLSGKTVDRGFWGRGSPDGGIVGVRSGTTRRSLPPGLVYRAGPDVVGAVGSFSQHLLDMEEGGRKSAGGGYFRIPTMFAQTPAGVDRNAGRSMKGVPGTFIITSKTGKLWIVTTPEGVRGAKKAGGVPGTTLGVAKSHKSGQLIFLYLLVKEVNVPRKAVFGTTYIEMQTRTSAVADQNVQVLMRRMDGA